MQSQFIRPVILLLLWPTLAAFGDQSKTVLLSSFESPADLACVVANNVEIAPTSEAVTEGNQALRVHFKHVDWPNIGFKQGQAYADGDWRAYDALAIDVHNPEDESIRVCVRVDDDPAADGGRHCITGHAGINPGASVTLVMPLTKHEGVKMRGLPPAVPGSVFLGVHEAELDLSHIVAFQLFLPLPERPHTLVIDNIRLLTTPPLEDIVDRYGQYTRASWPGKVLQDEDLLRQGEQEKQWLAEHPPGKDRCGFGGWQDGPLLKSTGFFRTAFLVDGKETDPKDASRGRWWLVTPEGRLFYSLGVDCVWNTEYTEVSGQENLFTWLPEKDDPLSGFLTGTDPIRINFYGMNLFRKYGVEWQNAWRERTVQRLKSWGFNTIGNWSQHDMFRLKRVPYTVAIHYSWDNVKWFETAWRAMLDVFDPGFATIVENRIQDAVKEWKDDPWCLGYFVDNELSWSGWGDDIRQRCDIPLRVLTQDKSLPSKQEFVKRLKDKYKEITELNQAWNTEFSSWEAFLSAPYNAREDITEAFVLDLRDFLEHFARRYFSIVSETIKKHAPSQLYLGCRFASRPIEVVGVSAEYCDVISFNIYQKYVDQETYAFTNTLGKPCIIGEFHFGALDRGMFSAGLGPVEDQEARGRSYVEYVRSVLNLPAFVGCHWFQYVDEPLTGRFDGENYNIGLVSFVDQPYSELVEPARKINLQVYPELGNTQNNGGHRND
ncbi:MAG: beta-galactosidase [bacterium]